MAITDNLISFWEFEEASGTRADSVVATGNDLEDTNGVVRSAGKVGYAAGFDAGEGMILSHASNASLQVGDIEFSIAFWFNADTIGTALISKYSAGNGREYAIDTYGASSNLRFYATSDNGTPTTLNEATQGTLSATTWYFVVCWHDPVANKLYASINNQTATEAAHSGGIYVGTSSFYIGTRDVGGDYYGGYIDQCGIWKRVLTSDERTWLYNSGSGRSYADLLAASPSFLSAWAIGSNQVLT